MIDRGFEGGTESGGRRSGKTINFSLDKFRIHSGEADAVLSLEFRLDETRPACVYDGTKLQKSTRARDHERE